MNNAESCKQSDFFILESLLIQAPAKKQGFA